MWDLTGRRQGVGGSVSLPGCQVEVSGHTALNTNSVRSPAMGKRAT